MKLKSFFLIYAIFAFALISFSQADLQWLGTINISPASPGAGEIVTFNATFKVAGGSVNSLLVVGGIDGSQLYQKNWGSLGKAAQRLATFTWTATQGTHTVYFELDPNESTGDPNHNNNYIEVSFTVSTGGPVPPLPGPSRSGSPNLVVKNVSFNPQSFGIGDTVMFSYSVMNTGDADAPQSDTRFIINGTHLKNDWTSPLSPGNSYDIKTTWKVDGCPANVKIVADFNNSVTEKDEADNDWSQVINCAPSIIEPALLPVDIDPNFKHKRRMPGDPKKPHFTIAGTPNLIVTEVDWSPKSFPENQKVTIQYRMKNIGNGDAVPRPGMSFTIDSGYAKALAPGAPGSSLPAGASSGLFKAVWTAKCDAKAKIFVDPDNRVTESNELDNVWEHTFGRGECFPTFIPEPVVNKPNLRVSGMSLSGIKKSFNTGISYNFDCGDMDADLNITVENDSNIAAPTSKYKVWAGGCLAASDLIYLTPHQKVKLGWFGTVRCGSQITIQLDVDNQVDESSENDNISTILTWKCN